jgi:hypothetical protein
VQADGPVGGEELTAAQSVFRRLVRKQEPAGDYRTMIVRETGRPELYLARAPSTPWTPSSLLPIDEAV